MYVEQLSHCILTSYMPSSPFDLTSIRSYLECKVISGLNTPRLPLRFIYEFSLYNICRTTPTLFFVHFGTRRPTLDFTRSSVLGRRALSVKLQARYLKR